MISTIPKWIAGLFESSLLPNARVIESHYISPEIKKIRFHGDVTKMNFEIGYANVIRVSETYYRNYTVANYDERNDLFDMIFHIHGNGVGSQYIKSLKVNDSIFISPPRGKKMYTPALKKQLFFGDETSLGLASSFLPVFRKNKHQFQFIFELNDENKNAPELLGLENSIVLPKNGTFKNEVLIKELPIIQQLADWQEASFILTGNVKSAQTFRKVIKNNTKAKVHLHGYWLEGKKGL